MNKKPKISSTAYRVLLLMSLLNEKAYSIDELNKEFSENPYITRTMSKEVILKYLSTLRSARYKIVKPNLSNNYTYKLITAPIKIKFSQEEIETLIILENYIASMYQAKLKKICNKLLENVKRYMSEEQLLTLELSRKKYSASKEELIVKYIEYKDLIQKFEKFCIEDQRIIIKYIFPLDDIEKEVILEPISIKYDNNSVFVSGYNPIIGEKQLVNLSYVNEIKQLPTKSKHNSIVSPVIFELKGRLAKAYKLHEEEKVLDSDPINGIIKIAAYVDDKNMLLQRLLRYGDSCEVLSPKSLRENIANLISESIKNYLAQ